MRFRRRELVVILVWAVALAALLNLAMDAWRLKYYQPRSSRWSLNAYALQQSGTRPDILFLGTSRTLLGINANLVLDTLDRAGHNGVSVFNVAQPASGVVTSRILLRDLIRSNGCPGVVVLEVSPASLNQNGDWWPNVSDYATVLDVPDILPSVTTLEHLDFLLSSALRGGLRLYDRLATPPESSAIDRQLATRGSRRSALTWRPEEIGAGPPGRSLRRVVRVHRRNLWRDMDIGGSTERALHDIAVLAEGCSARLVLIDLPMILPYSSRDEQLVIRPYLEAIHEFAASRGAVFFDANAGETAIEPGHFGDPLHLNLGGSIVFSERLAREVLLPVLDPGLPGAGTGASPDG
jgi:hypothetical protein